MIIDSVVAIDIFYNMCYNYLFTIDKGKTYQEWIEP